MSWYCIFLEVSILDDALSTDIFGDKIKLTLNTKASGLNWQSSDKYEIQYREEGEQNWVTDYNFVDCPDICHKYFNGLQPGTKYSIRVLRHVGNSSIECSERIVQIKTGIMSRYNITFIMQ